MKIRSVIPAVIFAGLLLVSCQTYTPETQQLLSQVEQQNSQIQQQQANLNNVKEEISYLQKKNEVLSREKLVAQKTLVAISSSVRNVFLDMEQTLRHKGDSLYDCVVGNTPIARMKALENRESLLLVDLSNPVPADMMLMEAQLYCHSPATVTFCLLRPVPETTGSYEIVATGEELSSTDIGKQLFRFSGRSVLVAKQGDFVGVLAAAGSKLSYDEYGTGNTPGVPLSSVERKQRVELPNESPRHGRAFSWQLWGFKR